MSKKVQLAISVVFILAISGLLSILVFSQVYQSSSVNVFTQSAINQSAQLHMEGSTIRRADGSRFIISGMNVEMFRDSGCAYVTRGHNGQSGQWGARYETADKFVELGINSVRLNYETKWLEDGIIHQPGNYGTYIQDDMTRAERLEKYLDVFEAFASRGIYVMPSDHEFTGNVISLEEAKPLFEDIIEGIRARGLEEYLIMNPYNEPGGNEYVTGPGTEMTEAEWRGFQEDTLDYLRGELNFNGIIVLDTNSWSTSFEPGSLDQLMQYDAGLRNDDHNLIFSHHWYPNIEINGTDWQGEVVSYQRVLDAVDNYPFLIGEVGQYNASPLDPDFVEEISNEMINQGIPNGHNGMFPWMWNWCDSNTFTDNWDEYVNLGNYGEFVKSTYIDPVQVTFPNETAIKTVEDIGSTGSTNAGDSNTSSSGDTDANGDTAGSSDENSDGTTSGGNIPNNTEISLTLIDATTDKPVNGYDPISTGQINLQSFGSRNLTFRANVNNAESVMFGGDFDRTENSSPYSLLGDNSGDYTGQNFTLGTYDITVTAYSQPGGIGTIIDNADFEIVFVDEFEVADGDDGQTSGSSSSSSSNGSSSGSAGDTPVNSASDIQECKDNYLDNSNKTSFSDFDSGSVFADFIKDIHCKDIVNGYPDGTYRPKQEVTRGEMAKFVKNAFNFETDSSGTPFPDVLSDHTFFNEIQTLKNLEIVGGFRDGTYKPDEKVTRGQIMKFLKNALEVKGQPEPNSTSTDFNDLPSDYTFYDEIQFMASTKTPSGNSIVGGYSDNTFRPDLNVNREQLAKMISGSYEVVEGLDG